MDVIRVRGLQRAGTNILEWLIENYVDNVMVTSYEKHNIDESPGKTNFDNMEFMTFNDKSEQKENRDCRHVCIMKDPYAHYISQKKHYPERGMRNAIYYWQVYNRYYYRLVDHFPEKVRAVKYIRMLDQPEAVLSRIDDILPDGEYNGEEVQFPNDRITDHNRAEESPVFDKSYYTDQKFLDEFTLEEVEIFNDLIDNRLVETMGYQIHET